MDIQRRDELYAEITELHKSGNWQGIIDASLRIADLNIPDLEKSIALGNAASSYKEINNHDRALYYFDKAIQLEKKHNRYSALERKAALLSEIGREEESLSLYRDLANRQDLFITDIQRFTNNIEVLEEKIKAK